MSSPLRAGQYRLLIEPDPEETVTESGIYLPDNYRSGQQKTPRYATIFDVGDEIARLEPSLQAGSRVLWNGWTPYGVIKEDGREYIPVDLMHVLCLVPG